jgi:hypothetical protein
MASSKCGLQIAATKRLEAIEDASLVDADRRSLHPLRGMNELLDDIPDALPTAGSGPPRTRGS